VRVQGTVVPPEQEIEAGVELEGVEPVGGKNSMR